MVQKKHHPNDCLSMPLSYASPTRPSLRYRGRRLASLATCPLRSTRFHRFHSGPPTCYRKAIVPFPIQIKKNVTLVVAPELRSPTQPSLRSEGHRPLRSTRSSRFHSGPPTCHRKSIVTLSLSYGGRRLALLACSAFSFTGTTTEQVSFDHYYNIC